MTKQGDISSVKPLDLTNQRFGRLVAVMLMAERKAGLRAWRCICDCGKEKIALAKTLRDGGTRSCGCLYIEASMEKVRMRQRPIGFERTTSKGYIEIKTEDGFRRKNIHVMEKHLGRRLTPDEDVHHKDEDKTNNELSNLELMTHAEHTALHNRKKGNKWPL